MNKLTQQFKNITGVDDLEYINTVHENQRKKTFTLLVTDEEKKYILKIIEKESPQEIKEKFYNEIEFYKKNTLSFVPKYIRNNDYFLQIEFVESITFREHLLKKKVTNDDVEKLFETAFGLYESEENKQLNNTSLARAYSHLGALATSGPIQTKDMRISFFDKVFSRVFLKFLRCRLRKVLDSIDAKNLKFGFSHGDLHYNNILLTSFGEIKLIDFENIDYNGFYDFDLIYLYVMVELFLTDEKFSQVKEKIINKICISETKLLKVVNIYRIAILLNTRFHVGTELIVSKVKLFKSIITREDTTFAN